jgi:glycosyltransferase involved in cell wall biosynthesis
MSPQLAIVLKGYPRLSETFVAQEIRALELRGFELCIFSLRRPYDPAIHPIHAEIEAPVHYLPEYAHDDWPRVLTACLRLCIRGGFWRALPRLVVDLLYEPTRNRLRRFAQAAVMSVEMPRTVGHYYCHFIHTPASVAYYASIIGGRSWSISAHAKDIWTLPRRELRIKLESADWTVTCTEANYRYLAELADREDKVELLYHGLDFERFGANPEAPSQRDGSDPAQPVRLLSVGRAVDKKGYDDLLRALAELPDDLHWRFAHIGGGELLEVLRRQARELGLEERIEWLGALPQALVLERYRDADLFVLPSRVSGDGDRDGLPNVLMEAQSQRLACLSTNVSGIPELIVHAETGWLVEERDAGQLLGALDRLARDPELRERLGEAGCRRVREHFSMQAGIDSLTRRLQRSLAGDRTS